MKLKIQRKSKFNTKSARSLIRINIFGRLFTSQHWLHSINHILDSGQDIEMGVPTNTVEYLYFHVSVTLSDTGISL